MQQNEFCIFVEFKKFKYLKKQNPVTIFTAQKWKVISLDAIFFYYLSKEFKISAFYLWNFINYQKCRKYQFILQPTKYDLIDYNWNYRVYKMIRERCELDHTLSWLSTLGGAYSALGDYFEKCAEIAGKISINQLKIALRLGDANIVSRCRLYFSLSLIQKHYFKEAKQIIYKEYQMAKANPILDQRLLRMCKGIWSKLQYEHDLFIKRRRLKVL